MSNWSKSIVWPVIGTYIVLFIILYVIPVWFGNVYGENYRYELIVAIIIGVPMAYLILQEKAAKNQLRNALENYNFEVGRKRDHENKLESQKAVFWFIHKDNIRNDMGKMVERYFHIEDYNTAKINLEKAKEKLSNIELFISLLKVLTLIVGAMYFVHSVRDNQIGKIQNQINNKVEKADFNILKDSVKKSKQEIVSLKKNTEKLNKQMNTKIDYNHLKNACDSIRMNHIKSTNNKKNIKHIEVKIEQIKRLVNKLNSIENTTENNR